MSGLSPMIMLLILWGGITLILVVLLIYRSTLTMHEDDQLFLSEGETQLAQEQVELQHRMNKLQPLVRACSALSVALLVAMAGMGLYDMYKNF
jgi:Tfp pilus assembly protein PilN